MKITDYLIDSLLYSGSVSDEDKEIIRFGLESIGGNLLGIVMTLMIGSFFKSVDIALVLWLLMFPLRKNAGGFHAKTRLGCMTISAVALILAFLIFTLFDHTVFFYVINVVIAWIIILKFAPMGNPSKLLDMDEQKVYRKRCRLILKVESVFFVAALFLKWEVGIKSITMSSFIVCMSLLLGVIEYGGKFKK